MSSPYRENVARLAACFVVAAALGAPSIARATPPPDADRYYALGVAALKAHSYEAARAAFARSYEISPRTSTLLSLALAELDSGHPLDAAKHLRAYTQMPDAPAEKVADVRVKMLPRAEGQLGRIQIVAPDGKHVRLDGVDLGVAPLPEVIEVMPGRHEVAVGDADTSDAGHSPAVLVFATAGEVSVARLLVDGVVQAPMPSVVSQPVPHVPPMNHSVPSGPMHPSSWSTAKTVTVISLASGAVVATGLGVTFALMSNHDANLAQGYRATLGPGTNGMAPCGPPAGQALPAQCSLLQSANDSESYHYHLGIAFYVGGGVLAAGAIATWLLWPSSEASAGHAWVRPMLGRTTGLELGASF